jgi:hypothetical protein
MKLTLYFLALILNIILEAKSYKKISNRKFRIKKIKKTLKTHEDPKKEDSKTDDSKKEDSKKELS